MKTNAPRRPDPSLACRTKTACRRVARYRLALGAGLVLLGVTGCGPSGHETAEAGISGARAVAVESLTLQQVESIDVCRTFTGTIRSSRSSELSFERPAKLLEVMVRQGDQVKAQQPLARVDTRHLLAQRRELQARSAEAAALLDEYRAGPRQELIAAVRAEVRDLRSQLDLAEVKQQRRKQLRDRKAISQEAFDESSYSARSIGARLESAQLRLDELMAGTRRERIGAQEAVVAQLDAALQNLGIDIEDSVLRAPFDGTISKRFTDEGTVVSPSTPIVQIVEDSRLEVWVGLPPRIASSVVVSSQREVTVEGTCYPATVRAVLPELDPLTRTRTVILELDHSAAGQFVAGQVVRMETRDRLDASGYWIPTAALARGRRGLWSTLVIQSDPTTGIETVTPQDIEILYTEGQRSLVRGMLKTGDRVVSGGTHRIVPGQLVKTVGASGLRRVSRTKAAVRQ